MPDNYYKGAAWLKIVKEGIAKGLNDGVIVLQKEMKQNMGTGADDQRGIVSAVRIYKKTYSAKGRAKRTKTRKNIYRAAAPGEFPGVRTGRLRQSINVAKATPADLSAAAGTNVKYGRWLEYGTYDADGKQLMKPRPWAMRSLMLAKNAMVNKTTQTASAYISAKGAKL
jgi:hypothetical protein